MGLLKRGEIQHSTLDQEIVAVEVLGGDVLIRGMTLRERLAFAARARASDQVPTLSDDRETFANVAHVLSWCVLDADREPLMTQEQWETWGSTHLGEAMRLFAAAKRLSLTTKEDLKKKSAPALN